MKPGVNGHAPLKTFIDLFAGIGGFRIALEHYGLSCVFSSEIDDSARKTYLANFDEWPLGDITKIEASEIPDHDVLCAGFPCQAFSISGKRLGFKDARGTLFYDIARITEEKKPKVLFLENVKNFLTHNSGKTIRTVVRILDKDLGYNVFYKVLNASDYGLAQSRHRIIIVAFRKDLGITDFTFPGPSKSAVYLKDVLEDLPAHNDLVIDRPDQMMWDRDEAPRKKPIQIGKFNGGGQGERIYSINGHAPTLSAYGGGVAAKTGAYLIKGKVRKLTPRECARLQGFPESFKIAANARQAYKQFGNSVPINVLKSVMGKIIQNLEEHPPENPLPPLTP